ncbi:MAG: hypothetical protein SFY81_11180 [Verrucomicrobiota bacterium]|nr:hypothetical protein [Verrucomicrobiota bacterium]
MNSKPMVVLLIVVCLLLSGSLYYRHINAEKKVAADAATIKHLSNQVMQAKESLSEQQLVNASLETNLIVSQDEIQRISNSLVNISSNLAKTEAQAKAAAEAAAAEMAKRDARISELEGQRDDLTRRMTELNGAITGLETEITETQRKLAASEGDRAFLLKELKRLQNEKLELERQFNDLAALRDQVRKLRDELSISRRLDWIRRGLYGSLKGAEKLQKGPTAPNTNQGNFDLNVELKQDGSVQVNPAATNAPAPAAK